MSETENFDYHDIDIADIWFRERNYFFSKEKDIVFTSKFLDKTQLIIQEKISPNFGNETLDSDEFYYNRQYNEFVESLGSIDEQLRLDYFFANGKCYVYDTPLIINKTFEDYPYWFTLKLRQYDGRLTAINSFLKYQLKKKFNSNFSKFSAHIKLCIRQYPELLSFRVKETTIEWVDNVKNLPNKIETKNNELKKDIQIVIDKEEKNVTKTKSIQTLSKKFSNKSKNKSTSEFIWTEKNPQLKSKQLKYLREQLESKKYIDKINPLKFESHFNGKIQKHNPINWLEKQYPLICLINELKPFLSKIIFTGKEESISIAKFARHFTWQGKEIKISNWNKVKSENERTDANIFKSIDLIINRLHDIT